MSVIIPTNITFVQWASLFRNTFPNQDISQVSSENDWKGFSNMLKSNRCFEDKYLPDAGGYTDWREWASEFLLSVGA